jgi:hypothetical protein
MKSRIVLITCLSAALAMGPFTPAFAAGHEGYGRGGGGYQNGGYHGGGPVRGLAGAIVGTAAAIVTLPFVILGSIAQGARYNDQGSYAYQGGQQPQYAAPSSGGYDGAPAASGYIQRPAPYYAPAPQGYYPPPAGYQAPQYYPPRQAYYAPQRPVYSAPPPAYYPPPPPADYYQR